MYSKLEVINPRTLEQALEILADGKIKLLAGGTDIMPALKKGVEIADCFLNLFSIKHKLSYINKDGDFIRIGALTTFSEIHNSIIIRQYLPLLRDVSRQIGATQIQNRATIGGNIANASPAGDSMPVLLVYNAELILTSQTRERKVPLRKFYLGYKDMDIRHDEIIKEIRISVIDYSDWKSIFRKVGSRQAQTISKISLAGLMKIEDSRILECRIAMGSVAPIPLRLPKLEKYLIGKNINSLPPEANPLDNYNEIREIINKSISPIDDVRSTREYRLNVAFNLIRQFLLT